MFSDSGAAIYTLGVGSLSREHLVRWLMCREVEYVIDTRSPPYAFDRQDFFPDEFAQFLMAQQMKYLDLHKNLGDRPSDISLHTGINRIDYRRYLKRTYAIAGVSRIALAFTMGCRVCVLGREGNPVYAHHARLIGQALHNKGIGVRHLTHMGNRLISHKSLIQMIHIQGDSVHFSPPQ